jgi:hypothetical protein
MDELNRYSAVISKSLGDPASAAGREPFRTRPAMTIGANGQAAMTLVQIWSCSLSIILHQVPHYLRAERIGLRSKRAREAGNFIVI